MRRGRPGPRETLLALTLAAAVLAPATAAQAAWLPTATLSESGTSLPDVALDARGDAALVANRDGDVVAATRAAGGAWSAPLTLDTHGGSTHPQVGVGPDGTATAVWSSYLNNVSVVRTAQRAPGGSWLPTRTFGQGAQPVSEPDVAVAPDGTATAVFVADGVIYAARRAVGAEWSDPQALSATNQDASGPRVAVDGAGRAVAAWAGGPVGGEEVARAATRAADGTWSTSVALSVPSGDTNNFVSSVAVAIGADGTAAATWQRDVGSSAVQAAVRPAAGPWQEARTLDAGPAADTPQVAVTAAGATVAWAQTPAGGSTAVRTAVQAPGGAWALGATVDVSVGAADPAPALVAAPDGALTLAFVHRSAADAQVVRTTRALPAGAFSLPEDRSTALPLVSAPALATDAGGDVLAAWQRGKDATSSAFIDAAVDDRAGPLLDGLATPATATVGVAAPLSVAPVDAFSAVAGVDWDLGDGTTATGASISHAWTTAAKHTLAGVRARDALGNVSQQGFVVDVEPAAVPPTGTTTTTTTTTASTPTTPTTPTTPPAVVPPVTQTTPVAPTVAAVDRTAPRVTGLRLTGRRISLRVSEAARVTVRVQRCVKRAGRTRCTTRRTLTATTTGAGALRLTVPRSVAAGRYRLAAGARDAAGNVSATRTKAIRLKR